MPHIHTADGQHDLTISGYVVRTDFAQPKLLLHKHKKLNKWLQFGGHVELDENPWQTIGHELLEESGYGMDQLKLLQPAERIGRLTDTIQHPQPVYLTTHPIATPDLKGKLHYHIDVGYAFTTTEEPKHKLGEGESDNIVLVDRDELLALNSDEIWQNTLETCLFIFDTCLKSWEEVDPAGYRV